jgi:glycosyltransferase involved in cell wall biosynthesis
MNNLKKYHFSVIIPVYNEFENLNELYENLLAHLKIYQNNYEIIFVDDGSTDNSFEILDALANKNPDIRLIQFRRNFGQTAAMTAGIEAADSELIIFMDSDLQNDAADIPILLKKINEGYDVVSGWRKSRKDKLFLKKVPLKNCQLYH